MSATDRDVLHAVCERMMKITLAVVDYLMDAGVGPFFSLAGEEYVAPPLHGRRDFDDFNVRYDKPIIDRIHERGGRVHVHCHGSIRTVFDGFLAMGVDVLHPFEPPPMGDITAAQAKARARGRLCLEGNIQIGDMYDRTPAQIREQTEALIATCFDDRRGLIVCPTASPFIYGAGDRCFEQFKAMVDAVHACG
jgi:uroporphyrinogen-III decarboxylase